MHTQHSFILVHLDDDPLELKKLSRKITHESRVKSIDFKVHSFANSRDFLNFIFSVEQVDFCILDIVLAQDEQIDGTELIEDIKNRHPDCVVVMNSFNDHTSQILKSLADKANDFISKKNIPENIVERLLNIRQNLYIKSTQRKLNNISSVSPDLNQQLFPHCVGNTIKSIEHRVKAILKSTARCILVEGESGTGKEVVADLFEYHMKLQQSGQKFIRLNCAALSQSLFESELFGHKKGSFTGALQDKIGFIEAAQNGMLFLDEISSLSLDAQSTLLRAIENQEIIRIGETQVRKLNVRFLCTSNIFLQELVEKNTFRNDLWQRLREVEIYLPPLRERKSEISEMIDFFCTQTKHSLYTIDPLAKDLLSTFDWRDGNVRELRNILRAMTEFAQNGNLGLDSIPKRLFVKKMLDLNTDLKTKNQSSVNLPLTLQNSDKLKTYAELCDDLLYKIMDYKKQKDGRLNISQLARDLNISRTTVHEKLKQELN